MSDELISARHLPVAPQRVWEAFTSPSGIAAFWGGSHATVAAGSVRVDLRPGGGFAVGMTGAAEPLRFVYVSVDPPRELVFDEPRTGIRTTVRIEAAGDGTELTVHQRKLPPELQTQQAADGLDAILEALARHLGSAQRGLVAEYFDGFRTGDHPRILATLTGDVEWIIHGHRTTRGKAEFDGEIENPGFSGRPQLDVHRIFEDGPFVVTTGEGRGVSVEHGPFRFAFNDVFTFRDGLIARVDSYVVPLS
jgi:uncharacterized protein YndB with AHSA1/START domain/ketosteroid isomerase-like protein